LPVISLKLFKVGKILKSFLSFAFEPYSCCMEEQAPKHMTDVNNFKVDFHLAKRKNVKNLVIFHV